MTTTTDEAGRWFINNVPPGKYTRWAAGKPSGTINVKVVKDIAAGQTVDFGDLNLKVCDY